LEGKNPSTTDRLRILLDSARVHRHPTVVHGAAIIAFGMTKEPEAAGLMYILTGLSVLLSPLLFYRKNKGLAWLAVALLVIAGLLALYIGASATFQHIPGWAKWAPWYGAVQTP